MRRTAVWFMLIVLSLVFAQGCKKSGEQGAAGARKQTAESGAEGAEPWGTASTDPTGATGSAGTAAVPGGTNPALVADVADGPTDGGSSHGAVASADAASAGAAGNAQPGATQPGSGGIKIVDRASDGTKVSSVGGADGQAASDVVSGDVSSAADESPHFGPEFQREAIMILEDVLKQPEHYSQFTDLQIRGKVLAVQDKLVLMGTETTTGLHAILARLDVLPGKPIKVGEWLFLEGRLVKESWNLDSVAGVEIGKDPKFRTDFAWVMAAAAGERSEYIPQGSN